MSPIIILYQSSIRTQLTLKENLNIQNHNHYIICTRSFTPPVNCLNLVSPPFLLASHLVIVYKLHKLKGLVLTQASLFLITVVRYNVWLQVNRKCVSYIGNNMNCKGLPLRFYDPKECLCLSSCSCFCFLLRHKGPFYVWRTPVFQEVTIFPRSVSRKKRKSLMLPSFPERWPWKKVKENVNTVIYLIKGTPLYQASLSSHHFEKQ